MANRREFLKTIAVGPILLASSPAWAVERNSFSGNPILKLLSAPWAELVENFSYTDPAGKLWSVPAGYKSNGASIPRALWTLAGGPWAGSYRDAAIIHDYYCYKMARSWQSTHKVFLDAMLARGVSSSEAFLKYNSVLLLGPRWNDTHKWEGFLEFNKVRRDRPIQVMPVEPRARVANAIADSHREAWERSIVADIETKLQLDLVSGFNIETYIPPTTFDYGTANLQAEQIIVNAGRVNDEGQLIIPTEDLLKYNDALTLPRVDAALKQNDLTVRQITRAVGANGPGF